MTLEGVRVADEGIYIQEDRYENPKEMFKFAQSLMGDGQNGAPKNWLDVGCATGEFIYHVLKSHSNWNCWGMDVSDQLIAHAEKMVENATFFSGSALEKRNFTERDYDWVTCFGVIPVLDDPEAVVENCLTAVKAGGTALLSLHMTRAPIDTIVRYRRSDGGEEGVWETGWNMYSRETMERIFRQSGHRLTWSWHEFIMPFELAPQDDTMRCWTTTLEDRRLQLINGASQFVDIWFVKINVESKTV